MDRITRVSLVGYKGLTREYVLDDPTILSGCNGSGKSSCLEAISYAISGRVPAGRKPDAVAAYFPPRGGSVRLEDSAGRWIMRGITRDAAKAKVSEVLKTSSDPPEGPPDLSEWQASDVVLDVREFLGLSVEKRREFVLRLCGGGEVDSDLIDGLALEYARSIGGPGSTARILRGNHKDLPEAVAAFAVAWERPRGLAEVLDSQLGAAARGKSLSEVFVRLSEVANEGKLGSRRAAVEASAAIRELEAEAKGARAASAAIDQKRRAVEALREEMSSYRARAARMDETRRRLKTARAADAEAARELQGARDAAAALKPGPEAEQPLPPAVDPRAEDLAGQLGVLEVEVSRLERLIDDARHAEEVLELRGREATGYGQAAYAMEGAGIGRAVSLLEEIPDEADPQMSELRAAVLEVAAGWKVEHDRLEALFVAAQGREADALVKFDQAKVPAAAAREALPVKRSEAVRIDEELAAVRKELAAGEGDYRRRRAAWESATRANMEAGTRLTAALSRASGARTALQEAEKRLQAVETVNGESFPQLEDLEAKLYAAQGELEGAEKALGAVQAYATATSRAEQARVDEVAWKHAETAIRVLRERVVGGSVAGLTAEINGVLEAAGRQEVVYLDLENERGRPAFDLGWIRGEAKTSITALSTGESVLFLAALSIALTRRSPGRRVLLVEADPLDTANLGALLRALLPQAKELEALVVATAATGWEAPKGWTVRKVGGGGCT